MDTGSRLAKMYINELMSGLVIRAQCNSIQSIENGYKGMLVVRSELKSMCPSPTVNGVAYIGIPLPRQFDWSFHTRIAQWCARRGTLQEELNNVIADEIQKATGSENVGVYIPSNTRLL